MTQALPICDKRALVEGAIFCCHPGERSRPHARGFVLPEACLLCKIKDQKVPGYARRLIPKHKPKPPRKIPADQVAARAKMRIAAIEEQKRLAAEMVQELGTRPATHPPSDGPGSELHALLAKCGLEMSATCSCMKHIKFMNTIGWQWCKRNVPTITGWLQQEYEKRRNRTINWEKFKAANPDTTAKGPPASAMLPRKFGVLLPWPDVFVNGVKIIDGNKIIGRLVRRAIRNAKKYAGTKYAATVEFQKPQTAKSIYGREVIKADLVSTPEEIAMRFPHAGDTPPTTLTEAADFIYDGLSSRDKRSISFHSDLLYRAMFHWMISHWEIDNLSSPLSLWFQENLGLGNFRDIAQIIVGTVVARVQEYEIDLEANAESYRNFWLGANIDPISGSPVSHS